MDALSSEFIKLVAKLSYHQLEKRVDYVLSYKDNLERVQDLYKKLEEWNKEIRERVEEGERKNEEAVGIVRTWLRDAEEQLKQFKSESKYIELLEEEDERKIAEKCCFGLIGWNPKYRHDLSRRAKKKADVINEMVKEMEGRGSAPVTRSTGPPNLGITEGNFCGGLKSREEKLNVVMDVLKNDTDRVNRIGIWGMGGAGKSTLVEEIARQAEKEKLFKQVVIAEISRSPNIFQIQDRIAERIGLRFTNDHNEERALQLTKRFKQLRESQTRDKKVSNNDEKQGKGSGKLLVILDNLWDKLDLHALGICPELEKDLDCKIVVTSRDEDVCKQMGVSNRYIYKVGDLSEAEAKLLFKKRVGEVTEKEEYKDIMEEVLKKCSRLPLTISVLADTLRNQSLEVWKYIVGQLNKSISREREGVLYGTYSVLEMSYNFIKDEEKKMFFLLCCIFQPGESIPINDLLAYGIGCGLFQYQNSLDEAIDKARKWANDLHSLSLLLEADNDSGMIKIHEDVRDAGISSIAAKDQIFMFGDTGTLQHS